VKVVTLSSWAGRNFDIAHGSLVDMPDEVALVRIDAGIVREATAEEVSTLELKPFPGVVATGVAANSGVLASSAEAGRPTERTTLHLPKKGKRR
jgi:hypothetical protein